MSGYSTRAYRSNEGCSITCALAQSFFSPHTSRKEVCWSMRNSPRIAFGLNSCGSGCGSAVWRTLGRQTCCGLPGVLWAIRRTVHVGHQTYCGLSDVLWAFGRTVGHPTCCGPSDVLRAIRHWPSDVLWAVRRTVGHQTYCGPSDTGHQTLAIRRAVGHQMCCRPSDVLRAIRRAVDHRTCWGPSDLHQTY